MTTQVANAIEQPSNDAQRYNHTTLSVQLSTHRITQRDLPPQHGLLRRQKKRAWAGCTEATPQRTSSASFMADTEILSEAYGGWKRQMFGTLKIEMSQTETSELGPWILRLRFLSRAGNLRPFYLLSRSVFCCDIFMACFQISPICSSIDHGV